VADHAFLYRELHGFQAPFPVSISLKFAKEGGCHDEGQLAIL
jgi:hypothetical protein